MRKKSEKNAKWIDKIKMVQMNKQTKKKTVIMKLHQLYMYSYVALP